MDAFIRDFCRWDHSVHNLMVSNNIYKNFYSRPYRIDTMEVCLVTGGKNHYSGLTCDLGAIMHYTTTVAYAYLRVNVSYSLL